MKIHKKGFTLVELIVVITILAILGSIAFIAMQGYTKSARDSQRIADVGQFRSGIEIFQVEAGVYPMPDNVDNSILVQSNPVNYPGTTGELVSNIARLSDSISDPATLEEYDYAIEGNKKSYQIVYHLEDDGNAGILNEAHAADFVETVVVGNYNGVFARSEAGDIATMPSLVTKASTTGNITTGTEVSFKIPGETTSTVAFTPSEITYSTTEELITNLQTEYAGVGVSEEIKTLEKITEISTLTASDSADQETFESGYLGQTTTTSGGGSTPTCTGNLVLANATVTNDTGLSSSTPYQNTDNTASCYFECTGSYTGMDCGGTDYALILDSGDTITHQYVRDVAFDSEGNMYVTGYYSGTSSVTFGNATLTNSKGNNDIFVAKIDTTGNVLWTKAYGGTYSDVGYAVAVDSVGDVYVTGYFYNTVNFGTGDKVSSGGDDVFVMKINGNTGNTIWAESYGGISNDHGYSIAIDSFGDVYLMGTFNGTVNFGTGDKVSNGSYDIFVMKINGSAGTTIWAESYGGTSNDYGYGIAVDSVGNVYVTGAFQAIVDFGTGDKASNGSYDIFVMKINGNTGTIIWAGNYGGIYDDYGRSIAVDSVGDIYVTGYFQGTANFGSGDNISNGSVDIFVMKIAGSTGTTIWAESYGGTSGDYGISMALDLVGGVYVTGYFQDTVNFGTGYKFSNGSNDIFVMKINGSTGTTIWVGNYGGTSADVGYSVDVDSSGNIGLGGYYRSGGFDMNGKTMINDNTGYWNGFVTKFYMQ